MTMSLPSARPTVTLAPSCGRASTKHSGSPIFGRSAVAPGGELTVFAPPTAPWGTLSVPASHISQSFGCSSANFAPWITNCRVNDDRRIVFIGQRSGLQCTLSPRETPWAKQAFMPVELRKGGLHVTGTPLWLDARRKSELSFVSHAHTDHIARHERVIATAATLRIMEHRLGPLASKLPAPYHRPFKLGDLDVELLPAGHVLGSAQIRIRRPDGHRVVYTGDIGLEPSS